MRRTDVGIVFVAFFAGAMAAGVALSMVELFSRRPVEDLEIVHPSPSSLLRPQEDNRGEVTSAADVVVAAPTPSICPSFHPKPLATPPACPSLSSCPSCAPVKECASVVVSDGGESGGFGILGEIKVEEGENVEDWQHKAVQWPRDPSRDPRVRSPSAPVINEEGYTTRGSRVEWLAHKDPNHDNAWLVHNLAWVPQSGNGGGSFVVDVGDGEEVPSVQGVSFSRGSLPSCDASNTFKAPWVIFSPQTPDNMYHLHNDNIMPLFRALDELGVTDTLECGTLQAMQASPFLSPLTDGLSLQWTPGKGHSPTGRRSCPSTSASSTPASSSSSSSSLRDAVTVMLGPPQNVAGSVKVFEALLQALVPQKVHYSELQKRTSPLCIGTARVGRTPRGYRPVLDAVLPYVARRTYPRAIRVILHQWQLLSLWARPIPSRPTAIFFQRGGSRKLANEQVLANLFAEHSIKFRSINPATLSPKEQAAAAAGADILVGAHGAALAWCLYLRPGSVCVELQPKALPTWETLLFDRFAKFAGVGYAALREDKGSGDWKGSSISLSNLNSPSRDLRSFLAEVITQWAMSTARFVPRNEEGG